MTDSSEPRRTRVERNIYRRSNGVFEIGFKDASGKQRWRTVDGGITAARALRDQLVAQRGRGERAPDNNRLRFGDAADQWLNGPVVDLRQSTQDCYRNAVNAHLRKRFGTRRLDAVTPDDLAKLVRDLRSVGLAESTISIVIGVTNRIYRYAARRLGWVGTNPISLMLPSERPKPSQTQRRRLFEGTELEETLAAAPEPYKTLFTVAALTGARLSELIGLTWANLHLDPLDDAEIEFAHQVDRHGQIVPTKTAESARTVPIPAQLAQILADHQGRSTHSSPADFVFATRSGRAFSQRNIARALRTAQTAATTAGGQPTYPVLHVRDPSGNPASVPHGAVPSMHSFRHTVASRALVAGESIDEVAFLLAAPCPRR
jgi:integrase